jgi:hypothetical protein
MEECVRCKEVDEDRRTLWMSCFYAMDELNVPFEKEIINDPRMQAFTLRVCKDCRSSWMKAIQDWFNGVQPIPPSCGSGIFIREYGSVKEVTREEFDKLRCSNE